jgi:hypothetical protein
MTNDPRIRSDFSRFLVHLTRKTGGFEAEENLISILRQQKLEARNFHCLFAPKLKIRNLTPVLRNAFKTVCFTETPLDQIHKMTSESYPRRIKLRPYGLVFSRRTLIEKGGNPAVYVNGEGTTIKQYLLSEFDRNFEDVRALKTLKQKDEYYKEIVHYYSLINVMQKKHDFSWEREWRSLSRKLSPLSRLLSRFFQLQDRMIFAVSGMVKSDYSRTFPVPTGGCPAFRMFCFGFFVDQHPLS